MARNKSRRRDVGKDAVILAPGRITPSVPVSPSGGVVRREEVERRDLARRRILAERALARHREGLSDVMEARREVGEVVATAVPLQDRRSPSGARNSKLIRAGSIDLRPEEARRCKPRPESSASKGGKSRDFIPWCKKGR